MAVPPASDRLLPLSRLIEILEQAGPASPIFAGAGRLLDEHLLARQPTIPAPTPRGPERSLTIGMASYDDYDGVYFSVQALRLFHPEVTPYTEIVVVDNHPEGPSAPALKQLESQVAGYRYVPYRSHRGTAVRDLIFREANSPFVLAMDSHVLFAPGALARLLDFLRDQDASNDLWQGPLLADNLAGLSTHFLPLWSSGMYGQWAFDGRAADAQAPPFEIDMQGLGIFACRKDVWPGLNPRFSGFGGEEGYLHEKIRRRGGRVLCLPFLRWVHRFNRPLGVPYRAVWRERVRNYLLGHAELALDPSPLKEHFAAALGNAQAQPLIAAAEREISGPFHYFDAVYSIAGGDTAERWAALDLEAKIRFVPAPETPFAAEIGSLLAHRAIFEEAQQQQLANVLVFDENFVPAAPLDAAFRDAVGRLRHGTWRVRRLPGATAYHAGGFARLLAELPETPSAILLWLRQGNGLDYLHARVEQGCEGGNGAVTGFGVSLFGHSITVWTDCRAAQSFLDRYLLPWLPRIAPESQPDALSFRVLRNREGAQPGFAAYAGGQLLAANDGMNVILDLLQSSADEKVVRDLPGLLAIHAGVVAWNGCVAVLPGASRAGKTTLVAELLKRGAVYYSDEYALLDAEGRVHAYPRALMLRNSGGWRHPVLPSTWNVESGSGPATVRLIAFLEWTPEGAWNLRRIPQSEAILTLLRNTPREMANHPEVPVLLRSTVSSAVCFAGERGDAAEAAGHLIDLMTNLG